MRGKAIQIITKDGREYSENQIVKEERDRFLIRIDKPAISIPLKDIKFLWIKEVDVGLTAIANLGLAIVIGMVSYTAWWQTMRFDYKKFIN